MNGRGAPPAVSVVMGMYNGADQLDATLESVRAQSMEDFELVVVNDGSTDPRAAERLARAAAEDPRLRRIDRPHEGLTAALRAGCAAARGRLIARIDLGDAIPPERLRRQADLLDRHPAVAFVSGWTEFCGPEWEPLYVERGRTTRPEGEDVLPPDGGTRLTSGPTCHGSVMFQRSAYEAAGGYRREFYYGQDWDLWYRLAERGHFCLVPEIVYRARVFPDSVSALNRERQWEIGRHSEEAFRCRRRGLPEDASLAAAAAIRPGAAARGRRGRRGEGMYFIGECLRRNGDPRCRRYFRMALRMNPLHAGAWVRLLQATARGAP